MNDVDNEVMEFVERLHDAVRSREEITLWGVDYAPIEDDRTDADE